MMGMKLLQQNGEIPKKFNKINQKVKAGPARITICLVSTGDLDWLRSFYVFHNKLRTTCDVL